MKSRETKENDFISSNVQDKAKIIQDSKIKIEEQEKILSRMREEFQSRKRALYITQKEIDSHCCTCALIHNADAHDKCQHSGCKRLHEKKITCVYLRKALKDVEFKMNESEKKINQMKQMHKTFCQELNTALDYSFRILDALNDSTC